MQGTLKCGFNKRWVARSGLHQQTLSDGRKSCDQEHVLEDFCLHLWLISLVLIVPNGNPLDHRVCAICVWCFVRSSKSTVIALLVHPAHFNQAFRHSGCAGDFATMVTQLIPLLQQIPTYIQSIEQLFPGGKTPDHSWLDAALLSYYSASEWRVSPLSRLYCHIPFNTHAQHMRCFDVTETLRRDVLRPYTIWSPTDW